MSKDGQVQQAAGAQARRVPLVAEADRSGAKRMKKHDTWPVALRPESLLEVQCGRSNSRSSFWANDGSCSERRRRRSGMFALVIVVLSFSCRRRTSESADVAIPSSSSPAPTGIISTTDATVMTRRRVASRPIPFPTDQVLFPVSSTSTSSFGLHAVLYRSSYSSRQAGQPGCRCHHHLHHHPLPSITSVPFGGIGLSFQPLGTCVHVLGVPEEERRFLDDVSSSASATPPVELFFTACRAPPADRLTEAALRRTPHLRTRVGSYADAADAAGLLLLSVLFPRPSSSRMTADPTAETRTALAAAAPQQPPQ